MRSTRTDTTLALSLALGLHLLLVLGIVFSPKLRAPPAKGAPVVAELVDARTLSPALRRALEPLPTPTLAPVDPTPLPLPEIEPPPRDLPELAPVPDLAPEREAARLREELAAAEREAERLREEQAAEAERQRLAEAERQRRAEAERRRRETEQQLERIRAERARAEREERVAEERVRELERRRSERSEPAPSPSPPPGVDDGVDSLRAQWIEAIRSKINHEWIRPDSIRPGSICPIRIRLRAGGEVISAQIQPTCPYDDAARRSVEAAVLKANPLPWAGYETVAVRDFIVRFEPLAR